MEVLEDLENNKRFTKQLCHYAHTHTHTQIYIYIYIYIP